MKSKKTLWWTSIMPLAVLPLSLIVACANNSTSPTDKPGDPGGSDDGNKPGAGDTTPKPDPATQETVAKTNLTAQMFGFTGTVAEAQATMPDITDVNQWIFDNRKKLLDGNTDLFNDPSDIDSLKSGLFTKGSTGDETTIGVLEFTLKAGKALGSDGKPTTADKPFEIEISGFKQPSKLI